MWFDKSKIFTAVNADEVKIGSKGFTGSTLIELKEQVGNNSEPTEIVQIRGEDWAKRFETSDNAFVGLFYLVEEPKEKTYRPYKDTDEMIEDFLERNGNVNSHNPMYNPLIWVKRKESGDIFLILSFLCTNEVSTCITNYTLKNLFENFTYLDGAPCGKLEE